jgi:hypothetical protein
MGGKIEDSGSDGEVEDAAEKIKKVDLDVSWNSEGIVLRPVEQIRIKIKCSMIKKKVDTQMNLP